MSRDSERVHEPVLLEALLEALMEPIGEPRAEPGTGGAPAALEGWFVDATLGTAGHARAILEAFPGLSLLGVDPDPDALALAREELEPHGERAQVVRARMSGLAEVLASRAIEAPAGMLLDLGVNSLHLDRPERGFSFQADGPLDMRMDPDLDRTAADVINGWDEDDLADLFYYEGGETQSRKIARAICQARRRVPFLRTMALAEVVAQVAGGKRNPRIHPATRTFQALRRAVNEEGEELCRALSFAERALRPGGRLAVITFHSGEDRMVKRFLREGAKAGAWKTSARRRRGPERGERLRNPRSRSAHLRVAERTDTPARRDLS